MAVKFAQISSLDDELGIGLKSAGKQRFEMSLLRFGSFCVLRNFRNITEFIDRNKP